MGDYGVPRPHGRVHLICSVIKSSKIYFTMHVESRNSKIRYFEILEKWFFDDLGGIIIIRFPAEGFQSDNFLCLTS